MAEILCKYFAKTPAAIPSVISTEVFVDTPPPRNQQLQQDRLILTHCIITLWCKSEQISFQLNQSHLICTSSLRFGFVRHGGSESDVDSVKRVAKTAQRRWWRHKKALSLVVEQRWTRRICALTRVTGLCTFSGWKRCVILKYKWHLPSVLLGIKTTRMLFRHLFYLHIGTTDRVAEEQPIKADERGETLWGNRLISVPATLPLPPFVPFSSMTVSWIPVLQKKEKRHFAFQILKITLEFNLLLPPGPLC